jgi:hypothetical protein
LPLPFFDSEILLPSVAFYPLSGDDKFQVAMLAFSYEQTLVPTRPSFLSYDYQRPDATASGGFIYS